MEMREAYGVLGIRAGAPEAEVRAAYKDLVTVWHPDRFQNNARLRQKAEAKLKHINVAFQCIEDAGFPGPSPGPGRHQDAHSEEAAQPPPPPPASTPKRRPVWLYAGIALACLRVFLKNRQFIVAAVLTAVTVGSFWKAIGAGLVFDDKQYVLGNPHVQNGLNWVDIKWALTGMFASNWHPLTWMSHMLDSQIWGLDPFGPHLVNVLLHVANVLLLFHVLRRMTGLLWTSAFVAALFAVHPLHVESVAWISERKDVLSTLFWMLTMLAYVRYAERPGVGRYVLVAALFALGLMSKPMLVSVPLVLLLMDYWPLRRKAPWTRLILEKAPLFVLSAASCYVTYLAQQASGSVAINEFPLGVRAANAAVSSVTYLWKTLVPARLAAFYPHLGISLPVWQVVGSTVLLIGITALVIVLARRKPYLAVGWFWYLITLLPVIGLLQVGSQAMADRYTYVPLIGVFVMLTWGIAEGVGEWARGRGGAKASPSPPLSPSPALLIPLAVIIACAVGTWQQTGYWKDEMTLCRHALAVTRGNFMMHNNLGVALYDQGDYDAAIAEYRKALAIASTYADVHTNLGNAYSDKGMLDEAVAEYNKSIEANPKDPRVHNNLGAVLERQEKIDEAIEVYQTAIELDPNLAAPHGNLAHALLQIGHADEAVAEYRIAADLDPGDAQAHLNLGEALRMLGSMDEAIAEYTRALWIRPDYPEAHLDMGVALIEKEDADGAIEHYRQALRSRPDYAEAHHNLAIALYAKGDYTGAWKEIALCRKYGLQPSPGFIEMLSQAMPDPGNG